MKVMKILRGVFMLGIGLGAAPLAVAQTSIAPIPEAVTSHAAPVVKSVKLPKSARFKTEAAAAASCPGDKVVWATLSKSHVFHLPGTPRYGKTKHGAYVCEKVALAAGLHGSKN
jgi:cytochrome c5